MRSSSRCLIGLLVAATAVALALPASARCLSNRRPIQGQLAVMRLKGDTGRDLKGYQIELAHPACADVSDRDGAPVRLSGVRTVQIITSDVAGERKLDSLVGEKIVIAGYLDAPDPARHTGDAVLNSAWLIAVPSTGEGGASVAADDGVADAAVPPPRQGQTDVATSGNDVSPSAYQPPADPNRGDVEARLAKFVTDFYLSGNNVSPDVLRAIYAARVSYFGKPWGINQIVKDKLNYYSRWPTRQYTLRPGTLAIRPLRYDGAVRGLYDLTFVYDFDVSSANRRSSGTGYARLQVDLAIGQGKIVRESGKVIARN